MKVLIDTDVVFDVYEKRQPHYVASNQVLCLARRNTIAAAIASHTVANLFYYYGSLLSHSFARGCLNRLRLWRRMHSS
jgi:predicted nucleic acid-binding protein